MKRFGEIALRYAEFVTKGKIPACKLVQQAAARHMHDLLQSSDDDYPYEFDSKRADDVCRFVELMPHTKGSWARKKELLELQPWQVFILASVFGWVHKETKKRRFRVAYIEVPRKNGKSQLSAAIGLYMLAADGDYGAEVYSGATTQKQALEVFTPARLMAIRTDQFRAAFGIEVMARNISIPENGSRFEPLIGNPGDGSSPSCAIVDEFHEHKTDALYETMITGMGAREQPLMWVITTAGSDVAGPCYALRTDVANMLSGSVPDDELFGIVYTIDEDISWESQEAMQMANPNLGISVSTDFIRSQIRGAIQSPRRQAAVKTKHLNIWVQARDPWMNMDAWNDCYDSNLRMSDFNTEPCWVGLDLASKIDITAVVYLFRRQVKAGDGIEEHFYLFSDLYVPEAQVENTERRHYQGWVAEGHLKATTGNVIDFDEIVGDILERSEKHRIVNLGYDPWGATQTAVQLAEQGVPVVEVMQTVTQLSEPMKWVEALVLARRFHHMGNPCMNWMVGNTVARTDAKDNVFPRKERDDKKIDGLVATLNAMRVQMIGDVKKRSVYEDRGIRTV